MPIDVNSLASEIMKELEQYSEFIDEKMQACIDAVTDEALEKLKNDPDIPKRTKKYSKGFYFKNVAQGRGFKRNVVANKRYRLTHLLEYGHLTRDGKRKTRAFPHWSKAQEIADSLPDRLKEAIET